MTGLGKGTSAEAERLAFRILFGRGRAVPPSLAKADTGVAFAYDLLCGARRAKDARLSSERTARRVTSQTERLMSARRHRPADEQSCDQRQPENIAGAKRRGPRGARS